MNGNSMKSPPPPSDTEAADRTDFASLTRAPDPLGPRAAAPVKTDFASLRGETLAKPRPTAPRSVTDYLIDAVAPVMIFMMALSVILFLLDVRYVYTAVHDGNLRVFAFMFVMGIVALNRLIVRDSSGESMLYAAGLAVAVGLYTLMTTSVYGMESVARNFMNDNPWVALAFNMTVIVFVWWTVNRLTRECCIDENPRAGEVGILTGAARDFHASLRPGAKERYRARRREDRELFPEMELAAFDPVEGYKPKAVEEGAAPKLADRIAGRHPGMAVFYFSVPVLLAFAFGLRVIQHGGDFWVRNGQIYLAAYLVAALSLLMLTSLGGLREYFRRRRVRMPAGIGVYWVGLGAVMICVVLLGALRLPLPAMPPIAPVDEHQVDVWARDAGSFQLSRTTLLSPEDVSAAEAFAERLGDAVLAVFGLFLAYAGLRGIGAGLAYLARNRERYPRFLARPLDGLERLIERMLRLPRLPAFKRRIRVSPDVALSSAFENSLGDHRKLGAMRPADHVMYAYDALCALAADLGAPRRAGQTANEFIAAFPRAIRSLRPEAAELTRLYEIAAYSPHELDDRIHDRLRAFWQAYNRLRQRYIR